MTTCHIRTRHAAGFCIFLLSLLALPVLPAQEDAEASAVWAPFASNLRVAVKDPQVRITWTDVPDFEGTYRIYRSTHEIRQDNLGSATLAGTVRRGEEYFSDTPPHPGSWQYAVLAVSPGGRVWNIMVPFRNVTVRPVVITKEATTVDPFTMITGIAAKAEGNSIRISMLSSMNQRKVILYRSASPITPSTQASDLVAVWRGTGRSIEVDDPAIPGVDWYYGAMDEEADQQGKGTWEPGRNATTASAGIPPEFVSTWLDEIQPARTIPLPALTLPDLGNNNILDSVAFPQERIPLSPETLHRLELLLAGNGTPGTVKLVPALLPSDRMALSQTSASSIQGSGARVLQEILRKTWNAKNWEEASRLLTNALQLHMGDEVQARFRYYLGQAWYHAGRYREALREFLAAEDLLDGYARPWIESCMTLL